LEGHAELASGDLFLQRFDIGVLLEQKSGDARNDAGFVPADNGDGGELSHIGAGNSEFSPQLHELRWHIVRLNFTLKTATFPAFRCYTKGTKLKETHGF
jgi:hypothetical protein